VLVVFKVVFLIVARLLFLVVIASSVTTAVCMASVFSMSVTLHYHCGTKADETHGIILQHFTAGSSFEYAEGFLHCW